MGGDPGLAFATLALRLDRVQPGLVDSWWGPPELAAKVTAEPVLDPRRLADDAAVLLHALARHELEPARHRSLAGRATALRSVALRLSGERRSWLDDVEATYAVRPEAAGTARFQQAHDQLAAVLPGPAPLAQRYRAYRAAMVCPQHRVPEVLRALTAALRVRTAAMTELPDGDRVDWELTTDAPWAASARHLGGLRSRVTLEAADFEVLAQQCRERSVAMQTIKSIALRPWGERAHNRATWYEPIEDQAGIDAAVGWVLKRPDVFLNTVGDIHLLPRVLDAASRFADNPRENLEDELASRQLEPLFV